MPLPPSCSLPRLLLLLLLSRSAASAGSLYDLLRNDTFALDSDLLLQLVRDVASGLVCLHEHKPAIVHVGGPDASPSSTCPLTSGAVQGDVTTRNILIDDNFTAKLTDFGLSFKAEYRGALGASLLTAPELLRGGRPSTASDIYALGMLLWECIARKDPFEGETAQAVLEAVMDERLVPPKRPEIPPKCPRALRDLIRACWAPRAQDRPTALHVWEQLEELTAADLEVVGGLGPAGAPGPIRGRSRKSMVADRTLLREVFPPKVAAALREGRKVEPEKYESVTIYFSDIVG